MFKCACVQMKLEKGYSKLEAIVFEWAVTSALQNFGEKAMGLCTAL